MSKRPFSDKRPIGPIFQSNSYYQNVSNEDLDPKSFVRKFERAIKNGQEEGRISGSGLGTLEWESLGLGMIRIEYGFHESSVDNVFEFRPMIGASGATTDQGTELPKLGGDAGKVGKIMKQNYNVDWEFAELEAASMAEALTDYEFEYEGSTYTDTIVSNNLDS